MSSLHHYSSDRPWFKLSVYSPAFLDRSAIQQTQLEEGDKLILPASILDHLLRQFPDERRPMPQPLIFEVQNAREQTTSHCGVLEFTSPNAAAAQSAMSSALAPSSANTTAAASSQTPTAAVYCPVWKMQSLLLNDGDQVRLRLAHLPRARKLHLQPHSYAFTQLPTPKATMEHALRAFTALTVSATSKQKSNNYYSCNQFIFSLHSGMLTRRCLCAVSSCSRCTHRSATQSRSIHRNASN